MILLKLFELIWSYKRIFVKTQVKPNGCYFSVFKKKHLFSISHHWLSCLFTYVAIFYWSLKENKLNLLQLWNRMLHKITPTHIQRIQSHPTWRLSLAHLEGLWRLLACSPLMWSRPDCSLIGQGITREYCIVVPQFHEQKGYGLYGKDWHLLPHIWPWSMHFEWVQMLYFNQRLRTLRLASLVVMDGSFLALVLGCLRLLLLSLHLRFEYFILFYMQSVIILVSVACY